MAFFWSRNLLDDIKAPANGSCPWEPSLWETAAEPLFGNVTFYRFNTYFSGACALFAALTIFSLQCLHATHFSRPAEQAKIMRVAHMIPAVSLISWFCVFYPHTYYFFLPWLNYVEAIALCSFFLLLLEFVAANEDQRSVFFAGLSIKRRGKKSSGSGRSQSSQEHNLKWYRRKWVCIFQYPIVAIAVAVSTDITESIGKYCSNSFSPTFAYLWILIIQNVSVTLALGAIISMWTTLRLHLKHHNPAAKLGAFKLVVGLSFIQNLFFAVLTGTGVLHPTATLTNADVKVGLPTMVACAEMVPISIFFHFAYSYRPYCLDGKHAPVPAAESSVPPKAPITCYKGGFMGWRAHLRAINPREVFEGLAFAFKMAMELRKHQEAQKGHHSDGMEPLRGNIAYQPQQQYGMVPLSEYPQSNYDDESVSRDHLLQHGPPSHGA